MHGSESHLVDWKTASKRVKAAIKREYPDLVVSSRKEWCTYTWNLSVTVILDKDNPEHETKNWLETGRRIHEIITSELGANDCHSLHRRFR